MSPMHRRRFLSLAQAAARPARRPDVLFLFADDQRTDTIAALGNPRIRTPHLDSLVRNGTTFRNAYCLGSNSGAVCLPSRNMLLSGRAYFRWQGPYASADEPNFPVAMRELGYETYHHGKRGNTALRIQEKFDHNKYLEDLKSRTSGEPGKEIVDDYIDFLGKRDRSRPLFAYLAFSAPHDPRVAARRYMDLYDPAAIPLPRNFMPLHPFDNGEQAVRDELLAAFPRTPSEIRKHLHDYWAVMTALDGHVGRLLDHLRRTGLYENTLIVWSADHGLAMGSHGLMGKQSLYDHSAKSPLIFSGPGVPRGKTTPALAYLLDIFPTVVDFAGGRAPAGLDGVSLRPVIQGRARGVRDSLFCSYRDFQRSVRDDRWKLIRYPHIHRTQLFDLDRDPDELHDLSTEPSQRRRVDRMMRMLEEWQKRLGDTLPLSAPEPRSQQWTPPSGRALEELRKKWKM